jgi:[acyl-carrier-protein] S-malonyltransferase
VPAFVFPGQGSQHPGMGRPWVEHPSWELVADASDVAGRDLSHLLLDASTEELTETRNAQLATFALSLLVLDAVERLGIEPTSCAGHSLGEYSALVAAGVLGFEDGVRVVAERGEAMQAAADEHPGGMAVITGSDAETVDICCRLADGAVWLANDNSTEETVIAGDWAALERAGARARALGARSVGRVAVGGAFHTPFMEPARDRLGKALAGVTFHRPEIPVVANVDARAHSSAEDWALRLRVGLTSPVRWRQSVARIGALGSVPATTAGSGAERLFVELGPGSSLCRLVHQTLPGAAVHNVSRPEDLDRLVDVVAGNAVRQGFAAGHAGEHLYVSERVVISPSAGVFVPAGEAGGPAPGPGDVVEVGSLLGSVAGADVRSPFAGQLVGMLAEPGERVQPGQPVAWLRVR